METNYYPSTNLRRTIVRVSNP